MASAAAAVHWLLTVRLQGRDCAADCRWTALLRITQLHSPNLYKCTWIPRGTTVKPPQNSDYLSSSRYPSFSALHNRLLAKFKLLWFCSHFVRMPWMCTKSQTPVLTGRDWWHVLIVWAAVGFGSFGAPSLPHFLCLTFLLSLALGKSTLHQGSTGSPFQTFFSWSHLHCRHLLWKPSPLLLSAPQQVYILKQEHCFTTSDITGAATYEGDGGDGDVCGKSNVVILW